MSKKNPLTKKYTKLMGKLHTLLFALSTDIPTAVRCSIAFQLKQLHKRVTTSVDCTSMEVVVHDYESFDVLITEWVLAARAIRIDDKGQLFDVEERKAAMRAHGEAWLEAQRLFHRFEEKISVACFEKGCDIMEGKAPIPSEEPEEKPIKLHTHKTTVDLGRANVEGVVDPAKLEKLLEDMLKARGLDIPVSHAKVSYPSARESIIDNSVKIVDPLYMLETRRADEMHEVSTSKRNRQIGEIVAELKRMAMRADEPMTNAENRALEYEILIKTFGDDIAAEAMNAASTIEDRAAFALGLYNELAGKGADSGPDRWHRAILRQLFPFDIVATTLAATPGKTYDERYAVAQSLLESAKQQREQVFQPRTEFAGSAVSMKIAKKYSEVEKLGKDTANDPPPRRQISLGAPSTIAELTDALVGLGVRREDAEETLAGLEDADAANIVVSLVAQELLPATKIEPEPFIAGNLGVSYDRSERRVVLDGVEGELRQDVSDDDESAYEDELMRKLDEDLEESRHPFARVGVDNHPEPENWTELLDQTHRLQLVASMSDTPIVLDQNRNDHLPFLMQWKLVDRYNTLRERGWNDLSAVAVLKAQLEFESKDRTGMSPEQAALRLRTTKEDVEAYNFEKEMTLLRGALLDGLITPEDMARIEKSEAESDERRLRVNQLMQERALMNVAQATGMVLTGKKKWTDVKFLLLNGLMKRHAALCNRGWSNASAVYILKAQLKFEKGEACTSSPESFALNLINAPGPLPGAHAMKHEADLIIALKKDPENEAHLQIKVLKDRAGGFPAGEHTTIVGEPPELRKAPMYNGFDFSDDAFIEANRLTERHKALVDAGWDASGAIAVLKAQMDFELHPGSAGVSPEAAAIKAMTSRGNEVALTKGGNILTQSREDIP